MKSYRPTALGIKNSGRQENEVRIGWSSTRGRLLNERVSHEDIGHCPRRRRLGDLGEYGFDRGAGLPRRHDYTVDVWADTPAAHFISDYVDVDGLKYSSRRGVYALKPDGTHRPRF
ncbi:hypothetical protein [Sinorhizobium meliloti]|uniref:hypothetical protein n=1 Tax=Rhizobium meliloti TaxID=382 RepID=UPI0019113C4B|nr:hypothetical protein [Sinorhizobium meliloti]